MFLVELLDRLLRASHRRTRCAVTIPLLFLYAVTVGASPSILRACVMLSMTQLAPLFRREKDPPTALGLALLLILLKNLGLGENTEPVILTPGVDYNFYRQSFGNVFGTVVWQLVRFLTGNVPGLDI